MIFSDKMIFFIGTVWPEPDSSAAGIRMMQLIRFFMEQQAEIVFGTSAAESKYSADLRSLGIGCVNIQINDSSFDELIQTINPDIVLFDRFMTEEQYGWRISDHCPDCIQILDSEDLHFLREGRRKRAERFAEQETIAEYLKNEIAMREISSIYRCDLTLIISEAEMHIMNNLNIPMEILHYLPIVSESAEASSLPKLSYHDKKGFFTIGNFRHPPNRDSIQYTRDKIWPLIRKALPDAEMHVYGSYPADKDLQLNSAETGFFVHGRAEDLDSVLTRHRVLLAPLRFGAGLKGKFLTAFGAGLPAITTTIGSEGLSGLIDEWPGAISNSPAEIAKQAVSLYSEETKWKHEAEKSFRLLADHFSAGDHFKELKTKLEYLQNHLQDHRTNNLTGLLLRFNTNRSTKFMSRWIEEKNKK